jgi:hypothetical protein
MGDGSNQAKLSRNSTQPYHPTAKDRFLAKGIADGDPMTPHAVYAEGQVAQLTRWQDKNGRRRPRRSWTRMMEVA